MKPSSLTRNLEHLLSITVLQHSLDCYYVTCGGGIDYLHRSPASRKKRQCPGLYLGHSVPGKYKYGDLILHFGESQDLIQ
jgi:hypothetical protein